MGVDPLAILSASVSLAILGILIWIVVMVYKWYKDPRKAPSWLQNVYYYFYPRAYEKTPFRPNNNTYEKFIRINNTSASNCASNCNLTENCNAFVYSESLGECYVEEENAIKDTTVMVEHLSGNVYTYIAVDSSKPVLGYELETGMNYSSPSTLIKTISGDYDRCTAECSQTANCVAISMTNEISNNCMLVNSTQNATSNSNVMSFMSTTPIFEAASF
jgi:hypothetical protein